MSENPYVSPTEDSPDSHLPPSPGQYVMFWLSCVLGLVMLAIAVNGGYQYWTYTSQAGMKLPRQIVAESVCVGLSGLGMFFSATRWSRGLVRAGAYSFGGSLLAFVRAQW